MWRSRRRTDAGVPPRPRSAARGRARDRLGSPPLGRGDQELDALEPEPAAYRPPGSHSGPIQPLLSSGPTMDRRSSSWPSGPTTSFLTPVPCRASTSTCVRCAGTPCCVGPGDGIRPAEAAKARRGPQASRHGPRVSAAAWPSATRCCSSRRLPRSSSTSPRRRDAGRVPRS